MFVEYSTISDTAKVWVYPSSRKFYPNEIEEVTQKIQSFIQNWKAGDEDFTASFQFLYDRFIVLIADDEKSALQNVDIDASVAFILKLQEEYNVQLLDKMNVCFKQGKYVQYKELKGFKKLLKNKAVTGKTIIFDNLVVNNYEFKNFWEIPIEDSWYNRFL
ncbi:ABC transporter ATPase [Polaribacter sp.]|uniref:ABC transporter ATPase n=1 Tax=Polaribacter sp. TaxID=1920175 RepID=UPI003F69ADEC